MKLTDLSTNWSMTLALITLTGLLFWGYGCPARVPSLIEPAKKVTRPELQIELDSIIATAKFRMADLDKQEQIRDLVFKNALVMVESGTVNPAGIITLLAGIYGIVHAGKHLKERVEKPKNS